MRFARKVGITSSPTPKSGGRYIPDTPNIPSSSMVLPRRLSFCRFDLLAVFFRTFVKEDKANWVREPDFFRNRTARFWDKGASVGDADLFGQMTLAIQSLPRMKRSGLSYLSLHLR